MDDDQNTIEARLEKLEKWAREPSWLDQPAEMGGEPFVMGDTFPIEAKIFGAILAAAFVGCVGLVLVAAVHCYLTGQSL